MKKLILILATLSILTIIASVFAYAWSQGVAVLQPQGLISNHQKDLFIFAIVLGLVALAPVFFLTYLIIHRYNANNPKTNKRYNVKWQIKPEASIIWGLFITLIIVVLAVVMYKSTYTIDPYKPIKSDKEAVSVRVVALPWKWLFIYPEQEIATVNELVIPVNTPISFELTADAPMSSFWIPKLGGMIYVMEGMVTQINLMATETGEFSGVNTEINGKGYAGMKFTTRAVSEHRFDSWVNEVRAADSILTNDAYQILAKPSSDNPQMHYSYANPALFGNILAKFMDSSHMDPGVLGEHNNHQHH